MFLKFLYGPITNPETNESKDIVVNFLTAKNVKDITIGMSLILLGSAYICVSMFKNGANAFEQGEYDVLDSLGLFK